MCAWPGSLLKMCVFHDVCARSYAHISDSVYERHAFFSFSCQNHKQLGWLIKIPFWSESVSVSSVALFAAKLDTWHSSLS